MFCSQSTKIEQGDASLFAISLFIFLYAAQSGKHLHSYCRADTVKDERCNVAALWSEVNHKKTTNTASAIS